MFSVIGKIVAILAIVALALLLGFVCVKCCVIAAKHWRENSLHGVIVSSVLSLVCLGDLALCVLGIVSIF